MNEQYDLELLGQKIRYPNSIASALSVIFVVLIVCATIYGTTRYIVELGHKSGSTEFYNFVSGFFKDKATETKAPMKTYQYGFWTPSEATTNYLKKISKDGEISNQDKWQIVSLEKNDEFGKKIKGLFFGGWRRYEVFGYGEESMKPGYWWVAGTNMEVDPQRFATYYLNYWGDTDRVYLEILTNNSERLSHNK